MINANKISSKKKIMKILFVCSANIDRSPTAEQIYSDRCDIEVKSAGVSDYAMTPISIKLIKWADIILCMEKKHKQKIEQTFSDITKNKIIDFLDIPDIYEYMNINLINIIREKTDAWMHNYHLKKQLVKRTTSHNKTVNRKRVGMPKNKSNDQSKSF